MFPRDANPVADPETGRACRLPAMPRPRLRPLFLAGAAAAVLLPNGVSAQAAAAPPAAPLAPVVVTASRAPQEPAEVPFSLVTFTAEELRGAPTTTLDGALRSVPGFSLFRRSDSLSAHPTAQGVSLRGLGPSGASRSLVLLDGIPLNDPFGGWVSWSKVPRLPLGGAEIVRGGGATAWGNAALGGVVQLFSDAPHRGLSLLAGGYGTRSAEAALSQPIGRGRLHVAGRSFETDGFVPVAPEDRGPIDIAAGSRHHTLSARWVQPVGATAEAGLTLRTFREDRNNGTPYQRNGSAEDFAAVTIRAQPGAAFSWTAVAYGQDQDFRSTFSAVNAARTAETPASDQFAVPSTALGAAWTGVWSHAGGARTSGGADLRRVRGETREHFAFANGGFTRRRIAGGRQDLAGVFALHERPLAANARATVGGRLDWWRESEGRREEVNRATGAVLRAERHASRDDVEFSPSAGVVWSVAENWRLRAAAQHAFRRPTLNELYRPFRVGNVITEANAALRTERVRTGEAAIEWSRSRPSPAAARGPGGPRPGSVGTTFAAAGFWNEFEDAVGNVTLVNGPANLPPWGFIPAGGSGRQRLNLDRVVVRGIELSARWQPSPWFGLSADYLLNDARVRAAAAAPGLAGRRLAQVPRRSATIGMHWRHRQGWSFTPRLRWFDRQYEDDENTLRLGAAVVVDLAVTHPLAQVGELFLQVENLTDARVETGRSAAGIVNTGTPRLVAGGIRAQW